MTRVATAYAGLVAACISTGALGYAVIWAYVMSDPPPVIAALPPASALPIDVSRTEPPDVPALAVATPRAPASEPALPSQPAAAAAPAEPAVSPLVPPVAPQTQPSAEQASARPANEAPPVAPAPTMPAQAARAELPAEAAPQSLAQAPRTIEAAPHAQPKTASETPVKGGGQAVAPPSPVAPSEHPRVGSTTRPSPPLGLLKQSHVSPRLAALPPQQAAPDPATASDAPQITVLRGGFRRGGPAGPQVAAQRFAALPSPAVQSPAAPRITILRGGPTAHAAVVSLLPPLGTPAVTVIRRPTRAHAATGVAPPGPLVLRIQN